MLLRILWVVLCGGLWMYGPSSWWTCCWPSPCSARRISSRVVDTKYGSLRGYIVSPPDKTLQPVEVFLGVPYASTPMRFMPPVSPAPWRGIRMADSFAPVCPQRLPTFANGTTAMPGGRLRYLKRLMYYLRNQSEDCLYLNIYAPAKVGRDLGPLPVMVFVHGESFEWNSGNPYDGTILASFGDVVVVTINFRLGILGFLRTGDDAIRGNYGLLDQVGALTWLAQNIEEFGGDKNNVTVIGQGYGAACVNFLMISPVARGYFHRAILHSGSALSPWAVVKDSTKYTNQVALALNCPVNNDKEMVACLRQRPLSDFQKVQVKVPDYMTAFGPTIDGIVIPSDPRQAMQNFGEFFSKYDLMVGVTKVEAVNPFTAEDMNYGLEPERRDVILRTFLTSTYEYHLNEIFALLVNEYTDWTRSIQHPINTRDATIEIISDALVVAPLVTTTALHSSPKHNTYFYNFAYQSRGVDYPRRLGCFTGEDLPYVLGAPMVGSLGVFHRNFTKDEKFLSETVMSYWTNFAKTGDPNNFGRPIHESSRNRSRFTKVTWPHYDTSHESYLSIGMRSKARQHYRAHKLSVWLRLIPLIHQEDKENTFPNHHQLNRSQNISTIGVYRRPGIGAGGPGRFPSVAQTPAISYGTSFYNQSHFVRGNFTTSGSVPLHPTTFEVGAVGAVGPSLPTSHPAGYPPIYGSGDGVNYPSSTAQDHSKDNTSDKLPAEAMFHGSYSTALSVTIAVGCSLLILNVLIFAGIYYQRDKNRLEAKLHKKNYKLKKVNEDLRCQTASLAASSSQPQKQPLGSGLPRAPPPSPVGQSSRHLRETSDHVVHFPSPTIVAQTLGNLKTPPKVPLKPNASSAVSASKMNTSSCELTSLTEVQPLLSQNNASGTLKSVNKNVNSGGTQKTQEIRV